MDVLIVISCSSCSLKLYMKKNTVKCLQGISLLQLALFESAEIKTPCTSAPAVVILQAISLQSTNFL